MCGIFGVVCFNGATLEESVLVKMGKTLTHRGPDAFGLKHFQTGHLSCFLGATRLKIIDLSDAANMPVLNEDGKIAVVCNGEIYNHKELRQGLKDRGHTFRTRTDSEVIPHVFEDFGEDCFAQLDGMFAIAIWDGLNGRLLLGRDRTGKKPLHYYFNGNYFAFASEIKALLSLPFVKKEVNEKMLPEYLSFGYINGPETLYKGIYELPPASYLEIEETAVNQVKEYWHLEYQLKTSKPLYSFEEAKRGIRDVVIRSVQKRLESDVPLGVLLSGGIDSAVIAGVAAGICGKKLNTFTVGFPDNKSFDERAAAKNLALHFGTRHTELETGMQDLAMLPELVHYYDMPCGDASALPTFLVCKKAKESVTVALTGDGGDEAFGGYDRFKAALLADRLPAFVFSAGKNIAKLLPGGDGYRSLRRRMERFCANPDLDAVGKHREWTLAFDRPLLGKLYRKNFDDKALSKDARYSMEIKEMALLHQLLYLNLHTYLPGDLNVKMDRMSMANSLEARSPFLDTEVLELSALLPPEFKLKGGTGKYILREAFKDILPPKTLAAKKHGFGIPVAAWLRGDLGRYFSERIFVKAPRIADYLNMQEVKTLFSEHEQRKKDRSKELWVILQLELWLKSF